MLIQDCSITQKGELSSPRMIADLIWSILAVEHEIDRAKEHFWVIGLNTRNQVVYVDLVSMGSLNQSVVFPRETFRMAIFKGVASLILCHNHPSGCATPSREDIKLTERLAKAGEILCIDVIDHVIVSNDNYYSIKENHCSLFL